MSRSALITGSSRGIGRGIALRLAERGYDVAINYLQDEQAARDAVSRAKASGVKAFAVQADVSKPEEFRRLACEVKKTFGTLDVFVANALGDLIGFMQPPMQATLDRWDEAFAVQARAFLVGVHETSSFMRDKGRIIAISYLPGSHGGGFLPYFAMGTNKAALEAMCRYFAVALAPRNITVNAVCPGITDDSIVNHLPPELCASMLAWLRSGWGPTKRPGTPADIGGAVAALCSEDAQWITGQTIAADGGASLMNPELPLDLQRP
jgi:NAD(P)-dependent dehydrogenase (short-subunit alcohol dehydrogenase family)